MKKKQLKINLAEVGIVLAGAFILCFWALYNQYPLYFNDDTALYLDYAFKGYVGSDRPILYGLFMYYVSLQKSVWLVIITQGIILSYITYLYFKLFSKSGYYKISYLLFIVVITFCTGASFDVSWLMADVFTPISILCVGLLLFVNRLNLFHKISISFLLILGITMHNSHFYICLGLIILLLIGLSLTHIREKYRYVKIKLTQILFVLAMLIAGNLLTASIHYYYGGEFKSSKGGEIFLFGNLVEMGIVNTYLEENCETKNYQICTYKDTLPNCFLWAPNSPISKMGGWEGCSDEFSAIIKDIITTPKYLKKLIYKAPIYTFKQLCHFDTGEVKTPSPHSKSVFATYYPNEYDQFLNAKQQKGTLNFDLVNIAQTILFGLALLFFIYAYFEKCFTPQQWLFSSFILFSILINAAICSIFSGVYFRYQARVVWLLLLPIFLYYSHSFNSINLLHK